MSRDRNDLTERAPSRDRDGRAAYRVAQNDRDVSTAVVEAVAELTDADPLAEGSVLYDVVDPDALNRLFDGHTGGAGATTGRVVFELRGCRVEVHADDELLVYEPEGAEESSASAVQSA